MYGDNEDVQLDWLKKPEWENHWAQRTWSWEYSTWKERMPQPATGVIGRT